MLNEKSIEQIVKNVYNFGMIVFTWDNFDKEEVDHSLNDGQTCLFIKDGKPFATISPTSEGEIHGWKRKRKKVTLKGDKTFADYLREERDLS